ncbi:hypothetical protein ACT691_15815 [Vibrio metschnikovii]
MVRALVALLKKGFVQATAITKTVKQSQTVAASVSGQVENTVLTPNKKR